MLKDLTDKRLYFNIHTNDWSIGFPYIGLFLLRDWGRSISITWLCFSITWELDVNDEDN
jgi:hypothetical protein